MKDKSANRWILDAAACLVSLFMNPDDSFVAAARRALEVACEATVAAAAYAQKHGTPRDISETRNAAMDARTQLAVFQDRRTRLQGAEVIEAAAQGIDEAARILAVASRSIQNAARGPSGGGQMF
jgi:hypothetical protein